MASMARQVVLAALFLIPFIPLVVVDAFFFPFITGKGFAFRILVEIAAAAWLILAVADKAYRPRRSVILLSFVGLIAWMFIADLFALNPHKAFWSNYERMDGFVTLAHMGLLFLVMGSVFSASEKLWRKWWLTFLAGAALVCGYGLLQIMNVLDTHQGNRIDATFGNAAYLPAYLLFGIAVAVWQGVRSSGWLRTSLFVLAGVQVFILLFTATRGALFGLIGALVVGAFLHALQSGKRARKLAVGIVAALVIVAGTFYMVRDTSFVKESLTLSRLSSVFTLQEELRVRFMIWHTGLEGIVDRPLIGYGHEGFNYVFNTYYDPALFAQEQWFDRAHNIYLDWLIAGGIPALLLFLTLLISPLVIIFRRKEFSPFERTIITSAVVAYGIQGSVVFDNLFTYVPLAALLAYVHARVAVPFPALERAEEARGSSRDAVAAAVISLALVVLWVVNVPGIRGSMDIIRAYTASSTEGPAQGIQYLKEALATGSFGSQEIREQMVTFSYNVMSNSAVSNEVRGSVVGTAIQEISKEIAVAPDDARLRLQLASVYRAAGAYDLSLQEVDAALALSPRKQTLHIERGITLLQAGRFPEAREAFITAYELDRSFAETAAYAAIGELIAGNDAGAEALLVQHYPQSRAAVPQALVFVYTQLGRSQEVIRIMQDRVTESGGSPDSRFALANAYAQFGRIDEALAVAAALAAEYPDTKASIDAWIQSLTAPAQ